AAGRALQPPSIPTRLPLPAPPIPPPPTTPLSGVGQRPLALPLPAGPGQPSTRCQSRTYRRRSWLSSYAHGDGRVNLLSPTAGRYFRRASGRRQSPSRNPAVRSPEAPAAREVAAVYLRSLRPP